MKAEEYKEKLVAEFKETKALVDKFDEFMKTDFFQSHVPRDKVACFESVQCFGL